MSTSKGRSQYFPGLATADKEISLPVLNLVPRSRDKSKTTKKKGIKMFKDNKNSNSSSNRSLILSNTVLVNRQTGLTRSM